MKYAGDSSGAWSKGPQTKVEAFLFARQSADIVRTRERSALGKSALKTLKALDFIGADGGTRTLTANLPRDFKSLASTIPPRPRSTSLTARGGEPTRWRIKLVR